MCGVNVKFVYMGRNVCHLGQTKIYKMRCYEKQIFLFWYFPLFWGVFEEWIKLMNWGIILPQFFWFLKCLVC